MTDILSIAEEWTALSDQLKRIKAREMQLRKELAEVVCDDQPMTGGRLTMHRELGDYRFTAVKSLNYNLDAATLQLLWPELSDLEKSAIKWKPELVLKNFKQLPEDSLVHEVVESKLAAPSLSFKTLVE